MNKRPLSFLTPNEFVKEFVNADGHDLIPKATQTPDGIYPEHSVFSIMRIEEFGRHIKFPIPPGRSTTYHFCWLTKGQMIRTDALQRYVIGPDTIWFYKSGNIMSTESLSTDAEGYYCLFDKEYILQLLKNQNSLDELPFFQPDGNPLINLDADASDEVAYLLKKMEREHLNRQAERKVMIGLLLCQLLLQMKRHSTFLTDKKIYGAAEILTHRFLQSLKKFALQQRSVTFYAGLLNVSPNHLNKCVKDRTGKPATAHIADMIILEAKVMLTQTEKNISEIAYFLGFEDFSYFSRHFKKHAGFTPKEYRESFEYLDVA
ncbi:helix-turn-helix domain-containing protein [Mucilaginibacter sp. OK098]|uniref:helix-turn-helix domain-containing protein n=1 Tax=Mucilaginibacter sp. OK098 TaxID=1855297 RepID=UPI000918B869|nr:helix-turn-helix domain-containing protein [Mucilaginibacter sp. OK098]SHN33549.1 AraC-type DNA-binding protein [Mucilaginibacter sp. OK098]